jgi:puromycin-sensitive aminopeptidase
MGKVARLLEQIVPEHYELNYEFGQQDTQFKAREKVAFELKQPARELVWHGLGLKVTRADVAGQTAAVSSDADARTITLTFEQELPAGKHELVLEFTGPIQDSLHGLYRSQYQADGQPEWMVMTQFEAVHAREAFVCIDEPSAKATFILTLTVDDGLTALSNAPAAKVSVADGRQTVVFDKTPKMSTYLLAWVVSKLAHTTVDSDSGVKVSVYSTPDHGKHLDYAVDFAKRSLEFYEDYFAIPYPLPKLDLVAVPNFAAGAMENWGLVTYRETDLLVDEANTSLSNKQRVSEVIAHELAHQWFGDLVTMAWWSDLWLNESFASWAETMTVDHLVPEWRWWDSFTAGLGTYAKEIDSLANTHPIMVEVDDPLALDEIFDAISYFKGQSIIRMLEGYLGAGVFREGLRIYLKRHSYGNTVTDDLWAALGEASGKDVAALMHAWTAIAGYPILSFSDGQVRQERFVASPREAAKLAKDQADSDVPVWPVPLAARLADGSLTEPVLVETLSADLPKPLAEADWFKPNPEQTGFYRTLYHTELIQALKPALEAKHLSPADRFGVVSDVWAATASGRIDSGNALQLTEALRAEPEYLPALAVYGSVGELLAVVEDDALRHQLEQFGQWLSEPNYERLGWDVRPNENHFDTLLRPIVLQQALRFEVTGAKEQGLKRFSDYAAGGELDPNIRSAVLYAAARFGDATHYEQLFKLFRAEISPHTRQAQLVTLGRFRIPELAHRTLKLALSEGVKSQDLVYAVSGVARTREHRELAWEWFKQNWDELVRLFGDGGHMLDRFPELAAGTFATHEAAKMIADFFAAHPHPAITRPVAQAVEGIEMRADWFERDREKVADFLKHFEPPHTGPKRRA